MCLSGLFGDDTQILQRPWFDVRLRYEIELGDVALVARRIHVQSKKLCSLEMKYIGKMNLKKHKLTHM